MKRGETGCPYTLSPPSLVEELVAAPRNRLGRAGEFREQIADECKLPTIYTV